MQRKLPLLNAAGAGDHIAATNDTGNPTDTQLWSLLDGRFLAVCLRRRMTGDSCSDSIVQMAQNTHQEYCVILCGSVW